MTATRLRLLPKLILAVIALIPAIASVAAKRHDRWELEADSRKADYIFLEGTRQQSIGNNDAYHELIARAFELNPDDRFLGLEYGYSLLRLADGDSVMADEGYGLMTDYVDANPSDFYSSVLLAAISAQIGDTDRSLAIWRRLHEADPGRPELAVRYAEVLGSTRTPENVDRALEIYDTLEMTEGTGLQLASQRIQLHYTRRDTAAMLREARRLLESSPTVVEYNVFAGDIYSQLGQTDSALTFYDRALQLDPSSGLAYYSRANYYRMLGDTTAYDREVFMALGQENLDVAPKIEILRDYASRLYSDTAQQPRIDRLFRRLVDMHPHEADIRNLYRDYLATIGDYRGAAEQASYSLDINPDDERQWLSLSQLWLRVGDFDRSLDAARRGLHYFPGNALLPLLAATSLSQTGDYRRALEMLDTARINCGDNDPETLSDILTTTGDVYYAMELNDTAFASYEEALKINPLNMTALNNAAYYLACENRDLDRALEMIQIVVGERPDESTSLDTYAWVLFRRGEFEEAREVIDHAIEQDDSPSAELFEHAGDIYFMAGDHDNALKFWKEALKLDPDSEQLRLKVKTRRLPKETP